MIGMGLSLVTVAFETSGHIFDRYPSLMEVLRTSSQSPNHLVQLIADDMCRCLFVLLQSQNLLLFSAALRVIFLTFEAQRSQLKLQLTRFLTIVMEVRFQLY